MVVITIDYLRGKMEIQSLLQSYAKKLYSGKIILLANVYSRTKLVPNKKLNIISEFFSESEFEYILENLKKCGYTVLCYFDENDFISDYLGGKIRFEEFLVFNFARNGMGVFKKSLIPTFCDLNKIKYTASDGYACSFARNKYHVNALLKYLGLKSLKSSVFNGSWLNRMPKVFEKDTYIVKPLCESASQGIDDQSIFEADNLTSIESFIAKRYNELGVPLILQKFIEGYEAKTTIIEFDRPYALPVVGVEIGGKRNLGKTIISEEIAFNYLHQNYLLADELGDKLSHKIQDDAVSIYKNIGMSNYGRIDCRIDAKTHEIYYMDFSTMPYFVSNGEMFYAFKALGHDITGLLNSIINSTLICKYHYSL